MVAQTLDYYIDLVCQMKRGNYRGYVYNAKPIFLLFILEQIDKKEIKYNRISFQRCLSDNSYENFSKQYTPKPTPLQYPFYHLQNEPFWHLVWKDGKKAKTDTPSAKFIRDCVDCAYLDYELWDLLQDAGNRVRLREAIVEHFINAEQPKKDNKEEEPATPRQLWALKLATGIDYRGRGLTKLEAMEMISVAKKKAEVQGIDPSTAEATPRQLRYLLRATGIDYTTDGLTKAEATKMIRELKEAEEDATDETSPEEATYRQLRYLKRVTGIDYSNHGLTKRQASKLIQECVKSGEEHSEQSSTRTTPKVKQPNPEPGSLEDILSKCKTREEQLEAARKFFGENK